MDGSETQLCAAGDAGQRRPSLHAIYAQANGGRCRNVARRASRAALILVALAGAPPLLAAGGWYLLIPPRSDQNTLKILDSEPLSKWTQQGAYDSASDCEAAKDALLTVERNSYYDAERRYALALSEKKDQVTVAVIQSALENYRSNFDGLSVSRCINSDDPRLRK